MTTKQFYRDEVEEGVDQVFYNVTSDQSLEEEMVYLLQNRSSDRIFWGFIDVGDTVDEMDMSYLEEDGAITIVHPDPAAKRIWVARPADYFGPINLIIGPEFLNIS